MKFIETKLKGLWIIEPKIFRDSRGFFMESYHYKKFSENGIHETFVQDNISRSIKGTLRGLHYQLAPNGQGKLVRVTEGVVFDVAVDIRIDSPTFGHWFGYILSAENRHALYIPPGFAHGFCVLTDEAEFTYKCTDFYVPEAERTIVWNDPQIGIEWPIAPDLQLMSEKDRKAPPLSKAEINFYF
jgi:dTDP-4-dehydrorhamnose 3,5-epimerase